MPCNTGGTAIDRYRGSRTCGPGQVENTGDITLGILIEAVCGLEPEEGEPEEGVKPEEGVMLRIFGQKKSDQPTLGAIKTDTQIFAA